MSSIGVSQEIYPYPTTGGIESVVLGNWDATTNDPDIAATTPSNGTKYYVSVAGTQDLGNGSEDYAIGDMAVFITDTGWVKQDSTLTAAEIPNDSGVTGSTVANALDTLDSDIGTLDTNLTASIAAVDSNLAEGDDVSISTDKTILESSKITDATETAACLAWSSLNYISDDADSYVNGVWSLASGTLNIDTILSLIGERYILTTGDVTDIQYTGGANGGESMNHIDTLGDGSKIWVTVGSPEMGGLIFLGAGAKTVQFLSSNTAAKRISGILANQSEAQAGTDNEKLMTSLRVAEAITALGGGGATASELEGVGLKENAGKLDVSIDSETLEINFGEDAYTNYDGVDDYAQTADAALKATFTDVTWAVMFKVDSLTSNRAMIASYDSGAGFELFHTSDGKVGLKIGNGGGAAVAQSATGLITTGVWYKLLARHTNGSGPELYLNDSLVATGATITTYAGATSDFRIANGYGSTVFNGGLKFLTVWDGYTDAPAGWTPSTPGTLSLVSGGSIFHSPDGSGNDNGESIVFTINSAPTAVAATAEKIGVKDNSIGAEELISAEVATAYNSEVAKVSAGEIDDGTEATVRRYSPADVKSFVDTHGGGGATAWAVKSGAYTAVSGDRLAVDTNGGVVTITLPATPSAGDSVEFKDYRNTWGSNKVIVDRNGSLIQTLAQNYDLDVAMPGGVTFVYIDATTGWTV